MLEIIFSSLYHTCVTQEIKLAKNTIDRNFGSKKARGRENKRIARDKLIDKKIRQAYRGSLLRHRFHSLPIEPMSPYLGADVPFGKSTGTAFPITKQYNKRPMPQFKDLSKWFKFDLATMAMQEYGFVTFNINLHPELEKQWVNQKRDPATELRARINKEIRKLHSCPNDGWEYAFIIEGWAKQSHKSKDWSNPRKVRLHIHGFAAVYNNGDEELFREALAKACGDGLKGYLKQLRANSVKMFKPNEKPTYPNYLFKYERRKDDRLGYKRAKMSRAATQLCEEHWNTITGKDKEFWAY